MQGGHQSEPVNSIKMSLPSSAAFSLAALKSVSHISSPRADGNESPTSSTAKHATHQVLFMTTSRNEVNRKPWHVRQSQGSQGCPILAVSTSPCKQGGSLPVENSASSWAGP